MARSGESGIPGITKDTRTGQWQVRIKQPDGKWKMIGRRPTIYAARHLLEEALGGKLPPIPEKLPKGIDYEDGRGKYRVRVEVSGRRRFLGYYETREQAEEALRRASC